jgi:hypothetical protein
MAERNDSKAEGVWARRVETAGPQAPASREVRQHVERLKAMNQTAKEETGGGHARLPKSD